MFGSKARKIEELKQDLSILRFELEDAYLTQGELKEELTELKYSNGVYVNNLANSEKVIKTLKEEKTDLHAQIEGIKELQDKIKMFECKVLSLESTVYAKGVLLKDKQEEIKKYKVEGVEQASTIFMRKCYIL